MRIVRMAAWECALWEWQRENAHCENAHPENGSVKMRILRMGARHQKTWNKNFSIRCTIRHRIAMCSCRLRVDELIRAESRETSVSRSQAVILYSPSMPSKKRTSSYQTEPSSPNIKFRNKYPTQNSILRSIEIIHSTESILQPSWERFV